MKLLPEDQGESTYICGEIRAPRSTYLIRGLFLYRRILPVIDMEDFAMDKKELAYTKQTVLTVKDWDAFQDVVRYWAKMVKAFSPVGCLVEAKKN